MKKDNNLKVLKRLLKKKYFTLILLISIHLYIEKNYAFSQETVIHPNTLSYHIFRYTFLQWYLLFRNHNARIHLSHFSVMYVPVVMQFTLQTLSISKGASQQS